MSRHEAITRDQPGYPRRLRAVPGAPERIYIDGAVPNTARSVAIVGARAASADAIERARTLARALAGAGVVVVSGGALGVDAAAHRGALDAAHGPGAAPTVAVLGCGIDVVYPQRHGPLYRDIRARGGALVSQFEPGAAPLPGHFVRRNDTIAGLADAVVVIGAGARSGSLYTARAALRFGRVLGAMPGSPGCERLIAQGAAVVERASDLMEALAGRPRRPAEAALPAPGSTAARVLAHLDGGRDQDSDELAHSLGVGAREVARALTDLELDGLAIAKPGQRYVRSALAEELLAS
ncbi:DNA-processing protein DprA [Haliangium sp.]|uniref:DNA-processing protein DprA n=1 Tax=Haliangium sp. TaxID=2663208 RepID=UPI003D0D015B